MAIADKINALAGTNAGGSIEDALDNLIGNGGGSGSSSMEPLKMQVEFGENGFNLNEIITNYSPSEYYQMIIEGKAQPCAVLEYVTHGHLAHEFATKFYFDADSKTNEKIIGVRFDLSNLDISGSSANDQWAYVEPTI